MFLTPINMSVRDPDDEIIQLSDGDTWGDHGDGDVDCLVCGKPVGLCLCRDDEANQ
jgi:hypothetical protein